MKKYKFMIAKIFLIIKKLFCIIINYKKILIKKRERKKTDYIYSLF